MKTVSVLQRLLPYQKTIKNSYFPSSPTYNSTMHRSLLEESHEIKENRVVVVAVAESTEEQVITPTLDTKAALNRVVVAVAWVVTSTSPPESPTSPNLPSATVELPLSCLLGRGRENVQSSCSFFFPFPPLRPF